MSNHEAPKKVSAYNRWLNGIEAVGNKLPHPIALFAIFCLFIIAVSAICAALGVSATGNLISNGEMKETTVTAVSLLTKDGMAYIFSHAVSNFTSYAPLGMVLVAMLGVGVAEQRSAEADCKGHPQIPDHPRGGVPGRYVQHRLRRRLCSADPPGGNGIPGLWPPSYGRSGRRLRRRVRRLLRQPYAIPTLSLCHGLMTR
jgi:hypothetical protein